MVNPSQSVIVIMVSRSVARMIQLFGIYVIVHGHYGPGGGFQGGALLAAGILLLRMTEGFKASQMEFRTERGIPLAAIGALLFLGVGFITLAGGGAFLEYAALPFPGVDAVQLRFYGILWVEVGIGIAVTAALVSIFDDLMGEGERDGRSS